MAEDEGGSSAFGETQPSAFELEHRDQNQNRDRVTIESSLDDLAARKVLSRTSDDRNFHSVTSLAAKQ
jgi:hypothetical protein